MVFLFVLAVLLIILIILVFSKIQIQLLNFELSLINKIHINPNYEGELKWYIFSKIPIFKIKLNKNIIKKFKLKEKFIDFDIKIWEERKKFDKDFFKIIRKLEFYIKQLNLKIDIGTENAALTSIIVSIISSVIALFLRNKIRTDEEQYFIIQPIYKNQNYLNIELSGIFEIKMNHIINIIYLLIKKDKKGEDKYERTSNRGSYDYSYE